MLNTMPAALGETSLSLSGLIGKFIGIVEQLIPVLFALALVYFMWSGVRYVIKSGEGGAEERSNLLWGVIALFVMFSIWGILQILCQSLLNSSC